METPYMNRIIKPMRTARRKRLAEAANTADLDDITKKMNSANINDTLEKTGTGTDGATKVMGTVLDNDIPEKAGADTGPNIKEIDTAHANGTLGKTGTDKDHVAKEMKTAHANRTVKETDNDLSSMFEQLREQISRLQMTSKGKPMDTTHIDRIGKEMDKSDYCPTCFPKGDEDYEVKPSSIQIERQLIARIPFYKSPHICASYVFNHNKTRTYHICEDPVLSSKQREAVDSFQLLRRQFLQDAHLVRPFLEDLEQIGVIADNFFFDGKLMERLSIRWDSEKPAALAYFSPQWVCDEHLQCHTGALGFHCQVHWKKGEITPAFRLEYYLVKMLHELCHAWVEFFTSKQAFSYDETIKNLGFRGHGLWFQNLMFKCLGEGSRHFKFEQLDHHLRHNVMMCTRWEQNDMAKFNELKDWIRKEEPDPSQIEKRMKTVESVSEEMIRKFQEVRVNGADVNEAIYLMGRTLTRRFSKAASPSAQQIYILPDSTSQKRKQDQIAQREEPCEKRVPVEYTVPTRATLPSPKKPGRKRPYPVQRLGQRPSRHGFSCSTTAVTTTSISPPSLSALEPKPLAEPPDPTTDASTNPATKHAKLVIDISRLSRGSYLGKPQDLGDHEDANEVMEVYYGPPTPTAYGWYHHDPCNPHYECRGECGWFERKWGRA
ncbi:MAG: hypothetical protein Q9174_005191 [Haloplaca sp. 1 TL-2023]